VFDTSSLSNVLKHYYRSSFPSFWDRFDGALRSKGVVSVREAKGELERHFDKASISQLVAHNPNFFEDPSVEEMAFIREIYGIPHFRQNLDRKKLLQGGYFADPFIIAKAKVKEAVVVTEEEYRNNGVKIPNICERFDVQSVNLEGFLTAEDWKF
jgi:Domain of unknown function (DUF4411)